MAERTTLDFYTQSQQILHQMGHGGVLASVIDAEGGDNLITLGWGLIGPGYRGHPVLAIAVTPQRHSWRFLESVPEFVIAVPDDSLADALNLCGTQSGRDVEKFGAAGLTRVPSVAVRPPSVAECPLNVECRVYTSIHPPHLILTPEHRRKPLTHQHTIYFAEVLGAYGWA